MSNATWGAWLRDMLTMVDWRDERIRQLTTSLDVERNRVVLLCEQVADLERAIKVKNETMDSMRETASALRHQIATYRKQLGLS